MSGWKRLFLVMVVIWAGTCTVLMLNAWDEDRREIFRQRDRVSQTITHETLSDYQRYQYDRLAAWERRNLPEKALHYFVLWALGTLTGAGTLATFRWVVRGFRRPESQGAGA